jgi:hypothetical protein
VGEVIDHGSAYRGQFDMAHAGKQVTTALRQMSSELEEGALATVDPKMDALACTALTNAVSQRRSVVM